MRPAREERPPTYADRDRILHDMGYPSYGAYMEGDVWEDVRHRGWEAHGRRCVGCQRGAFALHHVKYDRATLEGSSLDGLAPLCRSCHYRVEFTKEGHKRNLADTVLAFARLVRPLPPKKDPGDRPYGKPRNGKHACVMCGYRARKGHRYCRPCARTG